MSPTPPRDSRFPQDIAEGSALETIVRGHLWVEAELIAILEERTPFPERVDYARFSFPQKVALTAAQGFIRSEDVAAYLALNRLRNRVAHRLDAAPDESFPSELLASFGSHLRQLAEALRTDERFSWHLWERRLGLLITVLYMGLRNERELYKAHTARLRNVNHALRSAAKELLDTSDSEPTSSSPPCAAQSP